MFIDTMCITLVFIPMVLPLVETLGIDLVHFGVVIVLNMMIGLSAPPFGVLRPEKDEGGAGTGLPLNFLLGPVQT